MKKHTFRSNGHNYEMTVADAVKCFKFTMNFVNQLIPHLTENARKIELANYECVSDPKGGYAIIRNFDSKDGNPDIVIGQTYRTPRQALMSVWSLNCAVRNLLGA